MDVKECISRRLFDLCLDGRGRTPETTYFAAVVRAGVWIELAKRAVLMEPTANQISPLLDCALELADGFDLNDGGAWIDYEPFGFDVMTSWLLQHGLIRQVAPSGVLRRARFASNYESQRQIDAKLSFEAVEEQSVDTLIVGIIGSTGQLIGERRNSGYGLEPELIDDHVWRMLGDLSPAVRFADEYLRWRKRRDRFATSVWN